LLSGRLLPLYHEAYGTRRTHGLVFSLLPSTLFFGSAQQSPWLVSIGLWLSRRGCGCIRKADLDRRDSLLWLTVHIKSTSLMIRTCVGKNSREITIRLALLYNIWTSEALIWHIWKISGLSGHGKRITR